MNADYSIMKSTLRWTFWHIMHSKRRNKHKVTSSQISTHEMILFRDGHFREKTQSERDLVSCALGRDMGVSHQWASAQDGEEARQAGLGLRSWAWAAGEAHVARWSCSSQSLLHRGRHRRCGDARGALRWAGRRGRAGRSGSGWDPAYLAGRRQIQATAAAVELGAKRSSKTALNRAGAAGGTGAMAAVAPSRDGGTGRGEGGWSGTESKEEGVGCGRR